MAGACGGGGGSEEPDVGPPGPVITRFSADRQEYFVGETATLSVEFTGGTGRLEPGNVPVTSGQSLTTPPLVRDTSYRLIMTDGSRSVDRRLDVPVRYRERLRAIDMPFRRAGHAAVAIDDGRVLIVGGEDASGTLPTTTFLFDPATETFTESSRSRPRKSSSDHRAPEASSSRHRDRFRSRFFSRCARTVNCRREPRCRTGVHNEIGITKFLDTCVRRT